MHLHFWAASELTLVLLNPDISCFCKQCRSRSVGFWFGSALFAFKYVNLYQQSGSSNLTGWKLEMGVAHLNLFSWQGLRAEFRASRTSLSCQSSFSAVSSKGDFSIAVFFVAVVLCSHVGYCFVISNSSSPLLLMPHWIQATLFIPTLDTTTKFVIMTIWLSRNLRLKGNNKSQTMEEYCI